MNWADPSQSSATAARSAQRLRFPVPLDSTAPPPASSPPSSPPPGPAPPLPLPPGLSAYGRDQIKLLCLAKVRYGAFALR